MKKLLCILPALALCGCMNLVIPKTVIKGTINGTPFAISSPKDSELRGLQITVNTNGDVSVVIDALTTKMNPEVITTTAEGQRVLIQTLGAEIRQTAIDAAATAAKTAAK